VRNAVTLVWGSLRLATITMTGSPMSAKNLVKILLKCTDR